MTSFSRRFFVRNEQQGPLKSVPVELVELRSGRVVARTTTDNMGVAAFNVMLSGNFFDYWVRPLITRNAGQIGDMAINGRVNIFPERILPPVPVEEEEEEEEEIVPLVEIGFICPSLHTLSSGTGQINVSQSPLTNPTPNATTVVAIIFYDSGTPDPPSGFTEIYSDANTSISTRSLEGDASFALSISHPNPSAGEFISWLVWSFSDINNDSYNPATGRAGENIVWESASPGTNFPVYALVIRPVELIDGETLFYTWEIVSAIAGVSSAATQTLTVGGRSDDTVITDTRNLLGWTTGANPTYESSSEEVGECQVLGG